MSLGTESGRSRSLWELRAHVLVLLLLPFALLAALPDWFYSLSDYIDAWVYFGFFRHVELYNSTLFPGTYYGTRLGWILPGHLAYSLFEPTVAAFVLHSAFLIAAALAVYSIGVAVADRFAAMLAAVAFGLHIPLVRTLGSDYVNGAVVTYSVLSAAVLLRAHRNGSLRLALLAGVVAGAMVHSNIASGLLFPAMLTWLLPASLDRAAVRRSVLELLAWTAGIVVCTAVLAVVGVTRGSSWLFFVPSLSWVARMGTENPWDVAGLQWMGAPWMFAHAAMVGAAVMLPFWARRRDAIGEWETKASASFVVTVLIFVAWDYLGPGAMLAHEWYVSLLLPWTFIMLAVVIGRGERRTRSGPVFLAVAAIVLLVVMRTKLDMVPAHPYGFTAVLLLGGAASVITNRLARAAVLTAMLTVIQAWATTVYPAFGRVEGFEVINRGLDVIDPFVEDLAPLFLINDQEGSAGHLVQGLTSVYLWGYTIVSPTFPAVTPQQARRVMPGSLVVVIDEQPGTAGHFDRVFRDYGIRGRPLTTERLDTSHGPLYITVLRAREARKAA